MTDMIESLRRERDEARAEVEVLRGVGCREQKPDEPESGPCGVCLRCAEERGAKWAIEAVIDSCDAAQEVARLRKSLREAKQKYAELSRMNEGYIKHLHAVERERDEARAQLAALHAHARALCVCVERIRRDRPSGDVSMHLDALSMSGRCVEDAIANTAAAEALVRERDEARAEVERLRAQTDREVELRRAASAETERQFLRAERAERGGRTAVDADWLRENWSTVEDDEEILITAGGVRLWMAERETKRRSDQPQMEMDP